jgi:atypical dual specificity phosphatase
MYTVDGGKVWGRCHPSCCPWDLDELYRDGFRMILSLHPLREEDKRGMERFRTLGIFVEDFSAPTLDQLEDINNTLDRWEHDDPSGKVLVHCYAGLGRTGTVLASRLIHKGMTARDAMDAVRAAQPAAIETDEQEEVLFEWERRLRTMNRGTLGS